MKNLVYLAIIIFIILIQLTKAQQQTCQDCSSMIADEEQKQLDACNQNCQDSNPMPNNLFSNSIFTNQIACSENCQTDSIKQKKICELENCTSSQQKEANSFISCKLKFCSLQSTALNIFVGQQSEIVAPSQCKNVPYSTNEELAKVTNDCTIAFYSKAEEINFYKTKQVLDLQECLQKNCYNNQNKTTRI